MEYGQWAVPIGRPTRLMVAIVQTVQMSTAANFETEVRITILGMLFPS